MDDQPVKSKRYKHKLSNRMAFIVVLAVLAVSVSAVLLSSYHYRSNELERCATVAEWASAKAALCLDGDLIDAQMEQGRDAPLYNETEQKLYKIVNQEPLLKYLYVYKVLESGCYVVYDLDMPAMDGRDPGVRVGNDPDIYNRIDEFLAGGEVATGNNNIDFGTLLSAYTPVYDSEGNTVAYACADIEVDNYRRNMFTYVLEISLIMIFITLAALLLVVRYTKKHVTDPIQSIVNCTRELDSVAPENWLESEAWKNRVPVHTNDELEELYSTVKETQENVSLNVKKKLEAEQQLLQTEKIKEMNRQLEETIHIAETANKAKTDFLSRMSHDMRTPMNAIIGLSALTLDDAHEPDIVRENMSKMREASDFLLGLLNDILDMAKIEEGSIQLNIAPYRYSDFLMNMKTMFLPQCEAKGITISFVEPVHMDPVAMTDRIRINQVFFNILSNAVKFTPTGGHIDCSIEDLKMDGSRVSGTYIVTDTGIGMSEEFQKHMFHPFMQEDSRVTPELQGSGLGLSITKQLVELMGGEIRIKSARGKGTTVAVSMSFELIDPQTVEPESSDDSKDISLSGKHVLLVEDHPLNAQIARKLLEKEELIVTHAANGKVAVEKFSASEMNSFDIILMDVRMPVMSGYEATEMIRSMDRTDAADIPIIAMTANAYPEDISKGISHGMTDYLTKPVDPNVLYKMLRKHIK